jgi:hypothetical protein
LQLSFLADATEGRCMAAEQRCHAKGSMIRIYADFNCQNQDGRISLNTVGSRADIARYIEVVSEGLQVLLYMDEEVADILAILRFDGIWSAELVNSFEPIPEAREAKASD